MQDSYVTIDGAISIGDPDGKWTLSLIGNNLTDEIFINTAGPAPFVGPGDDQIVTPEPRSAAFCRGSFQILAPQGDKGYSVSP